jgi:citrate lyase subunit beta/citryl-CoA lyase
MAPATRRYTAWLFVPGDRPERFANAVASGADSAILDLEDAVAPARKDAARASVAAALENGLRACVRINSPASEEGRRDLAALAGRPPEIVMIPKAASLHDVTEVRERFAGAAIVALIESIAGMRAIDALAATGIEALAFGGWDLCAELGARPTREVLAPYRARVVCAARTAGIAALDTPFVALDDPSGLASDARCAVDFGFDGKLVIHPRHVAAVRAAFAGDPAEIARARGILAAAGAGGVSVYDGTMVDAPLVLAARRVLARAGQLDVDAR